MAKIIEEVAVRISADTRKLAQGMKAADKGVKRLVGGFKKLAGAIGIAFGARAAFRSFARTLDDANSLIKMSKAVGFAAGDWQQLSFAMDTVGIRAGALRIAMGDLQKRIGNPAFAKHFKAIGLDPVELGKKSKFQQLSDTLDALRKVPDNKLIFFSGKVFEEQAGKDMAAIIRQWPDFFRAMSEFEKVSGDGLGGEGASNIEELAFQSKLLGAQWKTIKTQVVGDVAPALIDSFQSIIDSGALQELGELIGTIAKGFGKVLEAYAKYVKFSRDSYSKLTSDELADDPETPTERFDRLKAIGREKAGGMSVPRGSFREGGFRAPTPKFAHPGGGPMNNITFNQTFKVKDTEIAKETRKQVEKGLRQ
jgi:hypothetical protein